MRTRYSFYNFIVSLITAIIIPLVGFLKVRFFVDLYGSDLNGLQVTIAQVITFLNICEIAFSLAFRQLLFKPLAENDRNTVLNIYYGARKIFRLTGCIVLGLAVVIAFAFPFFAESPLNYFETVGTFILLAVPYGISYFLMGPNFVIIADQKEYKINIWIQLIAILRMFLMIAVIMMKLPFVWIILIEGLNILLSNFIARAIALKTYPWLKDKPQNTKDSSFLHNAKYTIIQRLSTLATTQTDNIVISLFMGYAMSSVYGVYSYLTDAVSRIINSAITSPINSFGNLFNDEHADSYKVFTEFFNFGCYIASMVGIGIFIVMHQFVNIWMNDPLYNVPVLMALLFSLNIFYLTMREPIIISRDANGLFKDAKNNAYLLAFTKIVLSVVFIQWLGIVGVLLATLVSNWTVDFLYNPVLVYKKVFKLNPLRYYKMVFSRLSIAGVVGFAGYFVWNSCLGYIEGSAIHFVIAVVILGIAIFTVMTSIYAISYQSFRNLFTRVINILKRRKGAKTA